MNRKEDYIEDLFRNNEHLLQEKPPRRAWSKLEDKLDLEKAQKTRRIYRYISTAAAVIAIVAMVSAITLFEKGAFDANTQTVAMNEEISVNQELSLSDNASDWRKEYAPEAMEEAQEAVAEVITETVKQDDLKKSTIEPIAEAKPTPKIKEEVIETTVPTKPAAKKTTTEKPVIAANQPPKEIVAAVEEEVTKVVTAAPTVTKSKVVEMEKMTVTKRSKKEKANRPVSNASEPAIDGKMARVEPATESSNAMPQSTYSGNYGDFSASKSKKVKTAKPVISDFHWLLGSWKNTTTNGLSYEKWEITGKNALAANGYLIQGNDTVFIEKMELKQIRSKVYYVANLNGSKTTLKFELKSLENNIATFENTKNTFPKEVILTKDGNDNFVITYEEEMNEVQEQQLRYRNNIYNAKASRRMSRAGN